MVYANPAKMQSHLDYAAKIGVRRTVFDGEDELYKLAKVNATLPEG
jgi:diaminopimelate decarboxylase